MTVAFEALPAPAADACARLRDGAHEILGDGLIALWAYGAATFPDPGVLGDVDMHGILAGAPSAEQAMRLDELHRSIEADGTELDGWYVLLDDARRREPPAHAFRPDRVDTSWALHRAHMLAGRCVVLLGIAPAEILVPPTWGELTDALEWEIRYIEDFLDSEWAWAYAVWNACRILYSLATHDVVVSKRAAAAWALGTLPAELHGFIRAAGRAYDGAEELGDSELLRTGAHRFFELCRAKASA